MASRQKLKFHAARAGEEMRKTGKLVVRAPILVRVGEIVIRFLLGAVLAGAEIFGGYAPFGLGLVACSGSGVDGFCALLGASFGYLSFQGLVGGLRYMAAAILIFSVAFALFDLKLYRRAWFMPMVAAAMCGVTGFVYLADLGWSQSALIFFGTEILLAGGSTYFYRIAFSPWTNRRKEVGLSRRQTISLLILAGTILMTLSQITLFGTLSVGRIVGAVAVMAVAYKNGTGLGAIVGVCVGLGMDLAVGGMPFYAMAYALAGVMAGVFHRQGKLVCALVYVLSNALGVLWMWSSSPPISLLYEVFMASVLFMLLPESALRQVGFFVADTPQREGTDRARTYVKTHLEGTAAAFQALHEMLYSAFSNPPTNDNDAATVFDRAADRVCKNCVRQSSCWQRDYVSTYNALNAALPAMLERGRGEGGDFPTWFPEKCMKFPDFLTAANEEVGGLLYRRQYRSQLQESRGTVCRQYGALAETLGRAATELGAELTPDLQREKRLRQHLLANDLEGEIAAFYDESGHLRVELSGTNFNPIRNEEGVEGISKAVGFPLRLVEELPPRRDHMILVEQEPLMAVAGVAAQKRGGETVSGDTGTWFKHQDGSLYVLLCDGMGSGAGAGRESTLAVTLLEQFLRSGVRPEHALKTVATALGLRGEEVGGFTTIDLLWVDLFTGKAAVYKYGAAPTYIRQGEQVQRVLGSSLPAGLGSNIGTPDVTAVTLKEGDWVVLVSDGVAGTQSDLWVQEGLAQFQGDSPKDLAQQLIDGGKTQEGATDDRTALVLQFKKR